MRSLALACLLACGLAVAAPRTARAQEVKVEEKDVPKACIDAVKKKYPTAKLTGFEKETEGDKVTYEVRVEVKGEKAVRKIDVELSPGGKILAEEEEISKDALPEKVKKALAASKYGTWEIKRVERVVKEEKEDDPSYELVVTNGKRKFEIVLDKDGKITNEEEKKVKAEKSEKGEKDDD
jgi:hypothetical protein